ncbi:DUF5916 domain-containing protein [Luteibaculum oceani]|uniref:DUF5916 domain-containing protein n=1 Tax=Luteibaculum oceani TaxID=1294296 RepID=UPI001476C2C8|nr:DUF5916 domain-containing protein [Luteibaculum oceani]
MRLRSGGVFFLVIFTFLSFVVQAINENQKEGYATLTEGLIKVDGELNESEWQSAPIFTGFITRDPDPGNPANRETEVKILYNSESLFIGAYLKEDGKDNILRELSQRDDFANTDHFGVFIDAYKDGINGVGFYVTAAGVQLDAKMSAMGDDFSWNAVWNSAVTIKEDGWYVEMEIPYSALRFPDKSVQEWHLNFVRNIRRIRETSFWNPINPEVNGFFNQAGLLKGIEEIETPVRLQLYPYMSAYANTFNGEQTYSVNGGMDVKYGISDAFTLDMTLIPDFGQVQSDNQVLNLTPFEVRFNERRQFFTEGTELFNKGGLFYSRRIGGRPINFSKPYQELQEGEEVISNPSDGKLVNATKVSGRTTSGLGVGVFNAVSAPTYAVIRSAEGEQRQVQTDPLTNFSVLVLDQNLGNNSYVTLINTNVLRNGGTYDANVIGTEFDVRDNSNTVRVSGGGAFNKKYGANLTDPEGFRHNIGISKISGNFNYGASYYLESDTYDPNDLGFLFNNNSFSKSFWGSFNQYKPWWFLNRFGINLSVRQEALYRPENFVSFETELSGFFITKNFHAFGMGVERSPYGEYDYFEPRRSGYVFINPPSTSYRGWISTDYRKTFALDVNFNQELFAFRQGPSTSLNISPRVRVNNQLSFVYRINNRLNQDEYGYALFNGLGNSDAVDYDPNEVYFARRDRRVHEQILNARYIFTNRMGLTARVRHYWSEVNYHEFFSLQPKGEMLETEYQGKNSEGVSLHNTSFNAFNIDVVFTWVFLPGSELSVVWKDAILASRNKLAESYRENVDYMLGAPRSDSFSFKILYFIDYHTMRKKFRSNSNPIG